MKRPSTLMMLAGLGVIGAEEERPIAWKRHAPEPHPADSLPLPFRDSEKIRAAAEKRARRAKRGW